MHGLDFSTGRRVFQAPAQVVPACAGPRHQLFLEAVRHRSEGVEEADNPGFSWSGGLFFSIFIFSREIRRLQRRLQVRYFYPSNPRARFLKDCSYSFVVCFGWAWDFYFRNISTPDCYCALKTEAWRNACI